MFCHKLNLISSPFVETFNPLNLPKTRHVKINHERILSEYIKNLFSFLNLEIRLVEVFYSTPFLNSRIHTDSLGGDYTKINWIFGGENSVMHWYNPKIEKTSNGKTPINTDYISYEVNEVDHLYSERIVSPTLVQVGIPHNIENDYNHRWCVSLVYVDKHTNRRPTMEESIKIFKDHLGSE
jgi:hypothetical protein